MAFLSSEVSHHLTQNVVDALNKGNFWTINDIILSDFSTIRQASGVPINVLSEIVKDAREKYVNKLTSFTNLFDKFIENSILCPTGIPELTTLLDGGYQTGELVEIFGESETGKTEMCYLLCAEILTHFEEITILYIASNHDVNIRRIITYIHEKMGLGANLESTESLDRETTIINMLSRIEVARPTHLSELVHLLNTTIHFDRRNKVRCVIVDSLSFIVQDDILTVKSSDLTDAAAAAACTSPVISSRSGFERKVSESDDTRGCQKLPAVANLLSIGAGFSGTTNLEALRRETTDLYLHEVMRLLTNFSNIKSSIVLVTSSDTPLLNNSLTYSRPWSNAIDTRIRLEKMPQFSDILRQAGDKNDTVRRAIVTKHPHAIHRIGKQVVFVINENGIKAIRP